MKLTFIVLSLYSVIVIAITTSIVMGETNKDITTMCDVDSFTHRETRFSADGIITYDVIICPVSGTLNTIFSSDGLIYTGRFVTPNELIVYTQSLADNESDLSRIRLNSDVEPGKNWVKILREWGVDYQITVDNWDALTTTQILARMKIKMQRDAKFVNAFADFLVIQGY